MKISILQVVATLNAEEEISVVSDLDTFSYQGVSYPIAESKPFQLRLANVDNKKLKISGDTDVVLVLSCDRCLKEVPMTFDLRIERELSISDGQVVSEDAEEIPFLDETELDVDRLIYDEILVNWPTKVLCQEDCKGLCPVCGQDLNERDCGCDRQVADPRMARFQEVFDQCKEV